MTLKPDPQSPPTENHSLPPKKKVDQTQKIIKELQIIGFRNEKKIFTHLSSLEEMKNLKPQLYKSISQFEFSQTKNGLKIKLKFYDKLAALKLLAKINSVLDAAKRMEVISKLPQILLDFDDDDDDDDDSDLSTLIKP